MIRLDGAIEAKYEVLASMGEGGMGAVYKVRHRHLDQIRVIKLLRDRFRGDQNLTARFLREAKTAVNLRHPNIAEVIDYDVTAEGTAFIVMEFIEGVNLRELTIRSGGSLERGFVIAAALQSLSALGYLHHKGFIHRDISPDNMMLACRDGEWVVKLIDLGIAKALQGTRELTLTGHFIGKVRYASPEQFAGGMVDQRSDLYSLGVVLYELLTGAAPIAGSDYKAVIAWHLTRPPRDFAETDPNGRVPASLRAVILKALEKEPEERYQTAAAFAQDLAATAAAAECSLDLVGPPTSASLPGVPTTHVTPEPVSRVVETTRVVPPSAGRTIDDVDPDHPRAIGGLAASITHTGWSRRRVLGAIGVVLTGALVAGTFFAGRLTQSDLPRVAAVPTPAVRGRTAAGPTGDLVLNGLPWAEIVHVVGADGRDRVVDRPLYTPAVLTVEPGRYRVRFSNSHSGREVTVEAEVKANQSNVCEARLDEIDAATWLAGQGKL